MTEHQLAKKIQDETGLTLLASKKFIKAYKEAVIENLCRYGMVQFLNFGTYRISHINPNVRRDLVTKEFKEFPAVNTVRFRFSKKIIKRINTSKKKKLSLADDLEVDFMDKIFVYGSLKKGCYNDRLMKSSKFIDNGTIENMILYSLGAFPAILPAGKNEKAFAIKGEIYEVSSETLNILDKLEGNGYFYTRKLHTINTSNGTLEAWVYILTDLDSLFRAKKLNTDNWNGDVI